MRVVDTRLRMRALLACGAAVVAASAVAAPASVRGGRDEDEVRVEGVCSRSVTSELRLRADDDGIELRLEIDQNRRGASWRIAIVQERRVVWMGRARTAGSDGSLRVRRPLRDLSGYDTVAVRAWGPGGLRCRATATLPGD
jgi:hypothetical protein